MFVMNVKGFSLL